MERIPSYFVHPVVIQIFDVEESLLGFADCEKERDPLPSLLSLSFSLFNRDKKMSQSPDQTFDFELNF